MDIPLFITTLVNEKLEKDKPKVPEVSTVWDEPDGEIQETPNDQKQNRQKRNRQKMISSNDNLELIRRRMHQIKWKRVLSEIE